MNVTEIIGRFMAFGLYDKMTTLDMPQNIEDYVVAGNPGIGYPFPKSILIPDMFSMDGQVYNRQDFSLLTVSGNSMSPCGIYNGYELLTHPIHEPSEILRGDYIVINVDVAFYKYRHHGQNPLFSKILRRAVGRVSFVF